MLISEMMNSQTSKGRLYTNKNKLVFVASENHNSCPTINIAKHCESAKLRDDFTAGLKIPKHLAKLIFK